MPNLGAPELLILAVIWIVPRRAHRVAGGEEGVQRRGLGDRRLFFTWIALVIVLVLPQHRAAGVRRRVSDARAEVTTEGERRR